HNLRGAFIWSCKRAGVPYIGIQGLRHQHTSLLAHAGVSVKAAQQRLGHSNPMLTLDVYTHVIGDADAEAAAAVERLLQGNDPPMRRNHGLQATVGGEDNLPVFLPDYGKRSFGD